MIILLHYITLNRSIRIVVTGLGVEKDGMADVQWGDVEKVLAAVEQESNRMKSGE